MIKKAVQIGNAIVRAKSLKATDFRKAQAIVTNLIDSMRHYGLVGMAAPQIGVNLRIYVSEIRQTKTRKGKETDPVRIFINPRIISKSKKETVLYEGCGSIDYGLLFGPVKRPSEVSVKAYGLDGKPFTLKATGLLAKIMQHEIDHLNGILCIDHFMDTKKIMHREEYLKIKK
jgi:peptide deformylase